MKDQHPARLWCVHWVSYRGFPRLGTLRVTTIPDVFESEAEAAAEAHRMTQASKWSVFEARPYFEKPKR
jgi:hypothetical protein